MVMGAPAARTTGQGCSWVGLRWDARRRTLPRSLPNHEWCVSPHCFLGFASVSLRSVNRCSLGTAPPAAPLAFFLGFASVSLRWVNGCSCGTAPPAAPRRVLPRLRLGLASLGQSVLARHGAACGAQRPHGVLS